MIRLHCSSCGGDLIARNGEFVCSSCGNHYSEEVNSQQIDKLKALFGEMMLAQKEEQIANIRKNLFKATHEENINSIKIVELARELKKLLPDDFQAEFYDIANSGNAQSINKFLDGIDAEKQSIYLPDIINFMIKSLTPENLLAVNNLIERAYKQADLLTYDKYTTMFAEEAKKVDDCVYDVTIPREVFVAYSSADMDKVCELVDVLESEGISCFVAMRNLQHGKGAVANYEKHLCEAMDNCKIIVFVSSLVSRTRSDARTKELPYIRKRDLSRAPVEYQNDYSKLPPKYKKPRVEYLIENYKGMAAESYVKEFFSGNEYRYSPKEVAEAVFNILANPIETEATANDELKKTLEEQRKIIEQMTPKKMKQAEKIKTLLARAEIYYEQGDYNGAINSYNQVLDIDPDNKSALEGFNKATEAKAEKESLRNFRYNNGKLIYYGDRQAKVIKIPEGVTEIDKNAFKDCIGITSITIPASVKVIGEGAFSFCTNLKTVYWNAIECMRASKLLTFSDSRESPAFFNCPSLTDVIIGNGVKTIPDKVFMCCKISKIILPDSLTSIGFNAFFGAKLKSIILPKNLNYLSGFSESELEELIIPESVETINNAFSECKKLKKIIIPKNVKEIWAGTFEGCENLQEIIFEGFLNVEDRYSNLPKPIIRLCDRCNSKMQFKGCNNLRKVTLPKKMAGFLKGNLKRLFGDKYYQIKFTFT